MSIIIEAFGTAGAVYIALQGGPSASFWWAAAVFGALVTLALIAKEYKR